MQSLRCSLYADQEKVIIQRGVLEESMMPPPTPGAATDGAGLTGECTQAIIVEDSEPPVCNFVGSEYISVEACTGAYVEEGVSCVTFCGRYVRNAVALENCCPFKATERPRDAAPSTPAARPTGAIPASTS